MQAQTEFILVKRKRTRRPYPPSPLALTMATTTSSTTDVSRSSDRVTPSPSNSSDLTADEEEEDMAHCLILLARGRLSPPTVASDSNMSQMPSGVASGSNTSCQMTSSPLTVASGSNTASAGMEAYQCKTCSKSFNSFQALGGHRASHKKPNKPAAEEKKPAVMREKQDQDNTILSLQISNGSVLSKSRVHECSICGAEFGSGQALGGHMRRHRPIPAAAQGEAQGGKRARNLLSLDLNLPAPEDDRQPESKFPFGAKEQVIVFSASPLIDCHY